MSKDTKSPENPPQNNDNDKNDDNDSIANDYDDNDLISSENTTPAAQPTTPQINASPVKSSSKTESKSQSESQQKLSPKSEPKSQSQQKSPPPPPPPPQQKTETKNVATSPLTQQPPSNRTMAIAPAPTNALSVATALATPPSVVVVSQQPQKKTNKYAEMWKLDPTVDPKTGKTYRILPVVAEGIINKSTQMQTPTQTATPYITCGKQVMVYADIKNTNVKPIHIIR